MKRSIALLIFILLAYLPVALHAQCNPYYDIHQGSEWELETYNPKGKLTGKNHQKVTAFTKNGSGFTSTVHTASFNDKGKEIAQGDIEMKCENGTLHLDMRNYINKEQMKAFEGYEMKVESTNLETPSKLSIGQTLKDGSISMTAIGSAIPMKMTINISNRKVLAEETITTPAGTFKCFKISSDMVMQTQMGINMNMKFSSIEWIAEKVGSVKMESYDKNGKLVGYTLLTKRS